MSEADSADEPPLAEWAARPLWLSWARIEIKLRPTKCPARVRGLTVIAQKMDNLRTTLGQAEALAAEIPPDERGGVGVVLGVVSMGATLIAIDLDAVRDPVTGTCAPWTIEILDRFHGAFSEVSPSGAGIHIVLVVSAAEFIAIRTRLGGKQRKAWKRPPETPGAKAPGFEVLLGGFVTTTFNLLPNSAPTFRPASLDALHWLIEEAGPAFVRGVASDAPSNPPIVLLQDVAKAATVPEKPGRFIASASRMARFARDMDDVSFQIAAALAAVATKGAPGRSRAGLHRDRLCALPGRDRGSTRGAATITEGFERLTASFDFKIIEPPVRPRGEKRGHVTVWEFPSWWIKPSTCQSARKRDPRSACKRDPLLMRMNAPGLAAAEP